MRQAASSRRCARPPMGAPAPRWRQAAARLRRALPTQADVAQAIETAGIAASAAT